MVQKSQEFEQIRPLLEGVAKGIAHHFGSKCEVALHDTSHGTENTIAFIENGHVTGRAVGDGASEAVLSALRDKNLPDHYGYITTAADGKMLKSSTINIHNNAGDIIAVLCINYDISDFVLASHSLGEFLSLEDDSVAATAIPSNVGDLLDQLIEESRKHIGKPVVSMTKEEKQEAIRYLDSRGALLIKKSSERIAEFYGISKFTLYNYLNGANAEREEQ